MFVTFFFVGASKKDAVKFSLKKIHKRLEFLINMAKPRCFFDIDIGGTNAGRIVMEVGRLRNVQRRANFLYSSSVKLLAF